MIKASFIFSSVANVQIVREDCDTLEELLHKIYSSSGLNMYQLPSGSYVNLNQAEKIEPLPDDYKIDESRRVKENFEV